MLFPTLLILTTLLGLSAAKKHPNHVCCSKTDSSDCFATKTPYKYYVGHDCLKLDQAKKVDIKGW
ncbi:hypothetical protein J1614_010027 [Plenodomus biglobosus]|nr:hypothetical protein J1614_010027 [Plenodomus biglobosus]